ncbi:DUF5320 domain-containing protein [bacterium]|nr:DUF5320 domain-containing protein [bacterium]
MPGGDRTGPLGLGPMTGRAAGYCAGYGVPGFMNPYGHRGMGFAGGRGGRRRGLCWTIPFAVPAVMPTAPVSPYPGSITEPYDESMETENLRVQAEQLRTALAGIEKRLEKLESKKTEKEQKD